MKEPMPLATPKSSVELSPASLPESSSCAERANGSALGVVDGAGIVKPGRSAEGWCCDGGKSGALPSRVEAPGSDERCAR